MKKIIAQDDDIVQCSTTATFSIAVATVRLTALSGQPLRSIANHNQEIFIRYLTEQAHNVAKSERKPRKTIAYKDIGELQYCTAIGPRR